MSNRIDLSAHTRIEDMDGVWYLVTTKDSIASEWHWSSITAVWQPVERPEHWYKTDASSAWANAALYRIPLTDVAPVYEYREGEPWAASNNEMILCGPSDAMAILDSFSGEAVLHRRASIVCDTAEQFRALYIALKEARENE